MLTGLACIISEIYFIWLKFLHSLGLCLNLYTTCKKILTWFLARRERNLKHFIGESVTAQATDSGFPTQPHFIQRIAENRSTDLEAPSQHPPSLRAKPQLPCLSCQRSDRFLPQIPSANHRSTVQPIRAQPINYSSTNELPRGAGLLLAHRAVPNAQNSTNKDHVSLTAVATVAFFDRENALSKREGMNLRTYTMRNYRAST